MKLILLVLPVAGLCPVLTLLSVLDKDDFLPADILLILLTVRTIIALSFLMISGSGVHRLGLGL